MTLNLPDYRARERTFQLLTQVAGRAGRGNLPGQVFIQTYKPEDPVIQAAARQDYRSFFEEEFSRRRTGLYPPFTLLARLLVEGREDQRAQERARGLYNACRALLAQHPPWAQAHPAFAPGRRTGEIPAGQKPLPGAVQALCSPRYRCLPGGGFPPGPGEKRGHRYLV